MSHVHLSLIESALPSLADPAQRPSMEEVRDALHEMYSAEVRRSRKGRAILCGLDISEGIAQVQREHFGA
jgi:hypothetical protein